MKNTISALILFGLTSLFLACNGQSVATQNYLLDANAFNLETVVSLIRDGQTPDAAALQTAINDPNSGINNVDTDHDGQVDVVMVRETQSGNNKSFEFIAQPSSNPAAEPVTVATVSFTDQSGQVVLQAGYPDYVYGHDQYYYNTHLAHDHLFAHWLYSPHLPFVPVYDSHHYVTHHVIVSSSLLSTRMGWRSAHHLSTVTASARPMSFHSASHLPSFYQARVYRAPSSSLPTKRSSSGWAFWRRSSTRPSNPTHAAYHPATGSTSHGSTPHFSSPTVRFHPSTVTVSRPSRPSRRFSRRR